MVSDMRQGGLGLQLQLQLQYIRSAGHVLELLAHALMILE